ncbi:hypothetical protein RB653_001954 [Dictyostelium firmibasis]|uniref:ABC transporter domain-containing protein n=1 Tax=Dictyostelium firmibasis TaxID=79012 RepID=A0AAN7TVM3_9MYCE
MGEKSSQLKTLLKKNLLLKSKSKCGICCEIVFPIIIVLLIFAILVLVQAFKPNYDLVKTTQFSLRINENNIIIYGGEGGSLNSEQMGVINMMKFQLSNQVNKSLIEIEPYFKEINDRVVMEEYYLINSTRVMGGIWFQSNQFSSITNPFQYSIRLDSNFVLDTTKTKESGSDSSDYLTKNWAYIQIAMDQAIFGYFGVNYRLVINGQRYPDPYIELWQKWINGRDAVFKNAGSVFVSAGLLIFSFRLVTELVVEKETKIREGMSIMGLNQYCYFISWIITSLVTALPVDLIIICILKGSQVIHSTSWIIVIILLMLYLLTLLLLAFIFSMFFDKSKFAGLLTFLLILAINICGIFIGEYNINTHLKLLLCCLFSPVGIACSFYTMTVRDLTDILTVNWDYIITEEQVIGTLIFNIIFYTFLIWYLDKIVKTEYGTKEPWYFLFTKRYWTIGAGKINNSNKFNNNNYNDIESSYENDNIEMVPIEVRNKTTISIRNLRKEFKTGDGLRVAVNDLYLDMFDGQIHGLLGPNGSGKSTTIAMLTGLLPPTDGTAFILGNDITYQMSEIRKYTGVCLQTDIIWNQLTVLEHLEIYASLKGITNKKQIKTEAVMMANEVDLGEKLHTPAGSLSGGQKRKLCLGIAFIGRSSIIFLDEVSSGMDPSSRRKVWDFLLKYKKGRTIILTTHYLDEADYLADRISIISHGKLITDGSSLYLKNKYGVGYLLTCSKSLDKLDDFNVDQVTQFIREQIPDVTVLSNAGSEISFRLPTASLPIFSEFFKDFDENLSNFHIDSYGISVTTLEEVFLKIGTDIDTEVSIADEGGEELKKAIAVSSTGINSKQQLKGLLVKRFKTSSKDLKSFLLTLALPLLVIIGSIIVYKEVNNEVIFYNNSTQPLTYSLIQQYGIDDKVPIQLAGSTSELDFNTYLSKSPYFKQLQYLNNSIDFNDYLIKNYKQSAGSINFITPLSSAINITQVISYNSLFNFNYIHSWPVHVNLINDALLRNHNGIGIECTNMPFDHVLTSFQKASQGMNIQSIVYFIVIMMGGFSLMAGSFAGNISQERSNRIKRLLYISGCKKYIYWLSNLLWDYFFALILLLFTCIILAIVDENFRDQFGLFFLSLVLFSLAIIPLSYLLSYKFSTFGKSTGAITAIHFAIGVIMTIVMINLRIQVVIKKSTSLQDKSDIVDIIFDILSPLYAFSRIIFIISGFPGSLRLGAIKVDDYWSLDYGAIPIIILSIHSLVWTIFILLLDYSPEFKGYLRNPKTIPPPPPPQDEDSDVAAERIRLETMSSSTVEQGGDGDILQFKGLHKLFIGKGKNPNKNAVYNSTLGIPIGQTFGLLGLNGAGKTTTVNMLAGDILPTSGEIIINGHDLITDRAQALRGASACPQFDALITLLTAREQLSLYCAIKGVPDDKIKQVVEAFIKMMDLGKIANSNTGGYSGGNKRKVSLSIAMLGNPLVVFLDEPSSGCDPIIRFRQCQVISELGKNKVIILTSHSLSEIQALVGRMTIMRDGQFKCLGSTQHIKSKFGAGYSVEVKFKKSCMDVGIAQSIQSVLECFPNATILDQHDLMASLELPNPPENPIKVSEIFHILSTELSSILDDYSVSQTSLEQVFLKLTGATHEDRLALINQHAIPNSD